jgi:NADPH2:quinone reductase
MESLAMKAIVIHQHGGPEVLQLEELPLPELQTGQVLVRNQAIGVNFVDTQHRAGLNYPIDLPLIPGIEAAGVVEAAGPEAAGVKPGDRVGYAGYMGGDYAEFTLVPEEQLVPIPAEVSFENAAACMMQAMTAHCLAVEVYPIRVGDTVLIHAASSGVGAYLVQIAKWKGATVIGTVSSAAKAEFARSLGVDHLILYTREDFEAETMRLTGGEGVHAVFDAVGRTTFDKGIRVLRAKGYMVVYGLTSGPVPPFDINRLSGITGSGNHGSLFLTWATLSDYNRRREDLLRRASEVFGWIAAGWLKVQIADRFPLAEAAAAHRLIESRQVVGKILLVP